MRKAPGGERNFKKRTCIFTDFNLGPFPVSACAKPGFSVSGTSTLSGLFQAINELKRLMGYSKRLSTRIADT